MSAKKFLCMTLVPALAFCARIEPPASPQEGEGGNAATLESFAEEDYPCDPSSPEDIDFSRVGFCYGEIQDFPKYDSHIVYIEPEGNGTTPDEDVIIDRTEEINNALKTVQTPGTVVLKAGRHYVSGQIRVERNGLILRGETDESQTDPRNRNLTTVIGTRQDAGCASAKPRMILLGQNPRETQLGAGTEILGEHIPEGCMYVIVKDPSLFFAGDRVVVHRPDSRDWSHDLGMDEIYGTKEHASDIYSWYDYGHTFDIDAERTVVAVEGDRIYLDNPLPMALDSVYGTSLLYKCSIDRISGSGVEDLNCDNFFDSSIVEVRSGTQASYFADENHYWDAVRVSCAEHCWVRGVTGTHFCFSTVSIYNNSKNITVSDCHSYEPVSKIDGSRRYAFAIGAGQLCLVRDCTCEMDRHQFVTTGVRSVGPNVFLNCKAVQAYSNAGPHSQWATCTLYDGVETDGLLSVEDAQSFGYTAGAQGWQGANQVFWNCDADALICQNPQVSASNWCWGCTGQKLWGSLERTSHQGDRPDGRWYSHGVHIEPESLYQSQLSRRLSSGERLSDRLTITGK